MGNSPKNAFSTSLDGGKYPGGSRVYCIQTSPKLTNNSHKSECKR